jgi:hypothetical protein
MTPPIPNYSLNTSLISMGIPAYKSSWPRASEMVEMKAAGLRTKPTSPTTGNIPARQRKDRRISMPRSCSISSPVPPQREESSVYRRGNRQFLGHRTDVQERLQDLAGICHGRRVRRGSLHLGEMGQAELLFQTGLKMITVNQSIGEELGLEMHVYGPETHGTQHSSPPRSHSINRQ